MNQSEADRKISGKGLNLNTKGPKKIFIEWNGSIFLEKKIFCYCILYGIINE